jgi:hypothetical protein
MRATRGLVSVTVFSTQNLRKHGVSVLYQYYHFGSFEIVKHTGGKLIVHKVHNMTFSINRFRMLLYRKYKRPVSSFRLKEEHRQRVFENRVLIRIFGPKRDEVTRE